VLKVLVLTPRLTFFPVLRIDSTPFAEEAPVLETAWQDVRYGLRLLRLSPLFTATAALSLAIGIGANTTIFSAASALLLRPLPGIAEHGRLVDIGRTQDGNDFDNSSYPNYRDVRARVTTLTDVYAIRIEPQAMSLGSEQGAEQIYGAVVSGSYFQVLGTRPHAGRLLMDADDEGTPGSHAVMVISHELWQRRFGGDPNVVGQTVPLNGHSFAIIGIAPRGFQGTTVMRVDAWVPISATPLTTPRRNANILTMREAVWLLMGGRLKPGVTIAQANAELKAIGAALEREFPIENRGKGLKAMPSAVIPGEMVAFTGFLALLMALVGVVLLIACVNLANLLLAQAATREREMGIRAALGASRGRIARQLLTESVLLAAAGGVLGLVVAYWGRTALWSFRPPFLNNASIDLSFEPRVLAFTALMSLLTGMLFGMVPAFRASRTNLNEVLVAGGRTGAATLASNRIRSLLVVSEIGLATVALIGAGLFVRSMQVAVKADLGFDSMHIGFVGLNPGQQRYEPARGQQFYLDAMALARNVPGVEAASVASSPPFQGGILLTVFPEGEAQNPQARGSLVAFNSIAPGYFGTMRIAFKGGRDFTDFDTEQTAQVAVVNEALARQLWPGQQALNKRFTIAQNPAQYEVVGVVATSVINAVGEDPTPMIYRPLRQQYAPNVALLVRTTGNPEPLLAGVRDRVRNLDKAMPQPGTGTVRQGIEAGLWAPRMGAALLSIFGGLALLLAMIGVYGVMSYSVTQRSQEIGIRMALGARSTDVLALVLKQGMTIAASGTALGMLLSIALGQAVSTLLFGISGRDPLTLAAVTLGLTLVTLVACYVPARRASRVDPLVALRKD
jgi:putative ABC transport system permease protein